MKAMRESRAGEYLALSVAAQRGYSDARLASDCHGPSVELVLVLVSVSYVSLVIVRSYS